MTAIATSTLPLQLAWRGKVRDVYHVDDGRVLLVATDRVSAFDVVMHEAVPYKGAVLTQLTAWWLRQLESRIPHHMLTADADEIAREVPALDSSRDALRLRAMLCRRVHIVPIECVIRGYITGSAWKEYAKSGTLAGEPLPKGLKESQRLEPPIFSPATKAQTGHDENITFAHVQKLLGNELAGRLRDLTLRVYEHGRDVAGERGIILADTKLEFGIDASGTLLLIDEVLTPDSSRFWPKESYAVGRGQPSLDKQPIRDFLDGLKDWNKAPPAPDLPLSVVKATSERYQDVFRRLTGTALSTYSPPRFGTDR